MTERLTGIDSIMALDVLRKLAEEGVRVTVTYDADAKLYSIELEGGVFGKGPSTTTGGVTFGDAVESALDLFRGAWADAVTTPEQPPPPEGPPLEVIREDGRLVCQHEGCPKTQWKRYQPYCSKHARERNLEAR